MSSVIERAKPLESNNEPISSSKELYLKILGRKNFPNNPSELPQYLHLPSGLLVPLMKSIIKTDTDGKERGGYLKWDSSRKLLISRKYRIGTKNLIIRSPRAVFTGIFGQPIVDWHTHPDGEYLPSNHDIVVFSDTKNALIRLVGSRGIISAMLATNESGNIPTNRFFKEYRDYDFNKARKAINLGIGLYISYRTENGFEFIKQES